MTESGKQNCPDSPRGKLQLFLGRPLLFLIAFSALTQSSSPPFFTPLHLGNAFFPLLGVPFLFAASQRGAGAFLELHQGERERERRPTPISGPSMYYSTSTTRGGRGKEGPLFLPTKHSLSVVPTTTTPPTTTRSSLIPQSSRY